MRESFEAEKFFYGEKTPVFLAYVFLSGKSADPNPPPS